MVKFIQNKTRQKGSKIHESGSRRKKLYGILLLSMLIACFLPVTGTLAATKSKTGTAYSMMIYSGKSMRLSNYMENVSSLSEYMDSADDISYSFGNKKVATVSNNGIIKGIAKGKTQITVAFRSFEYSEKKGDFASVTRKKQINVQVIPDDGSTGGECFEYELSKGSITITGLKKKVTNLVIPRVIDGFPVNKIGDSAFLEAKIQSFTCMDNIVSIDEEAFGFCRSLKTVELNNSVTKMGENIFLDCTNLETVKLPDNLETIPYGTFENCGKLKEVNLSNKIKTIGGSAFSGCSSLNSSVLPENIEVYGDSAFSYCTGLEKLVLTNRVKKIGHYAFNHCTSLKSVELSDTGADSTVTADKLTKSNIIGQGAFGECTSLTEVQLPDNLTTMYDAVFYECKNLTDIKLPKRLTSIGQIAFQECTSLEGVELPKSLKTMGDSCFYQCDKLKSITFPEGLTSIGDTFFCECKELSEVTIPDSLVKLGECAFYCCSSLSKVTVNNEITRKVDDDVFMGTPFDSIVKAYVNKVTFHFTEADWNKINKYLGVLKEIGVQDTDSDLEKIRKVHDWLIINVSYSKKQFDKYYPDMGIVGTVLDKRFAVCSGYADTFTLLMTLLNVECINKGSGPMNHVWNMVKLDDGCWYHVDVTWDDPGYDVEVWQKGTLRYLNLLRDDAGIRATGHHDWDADAPVANGTKYLNYFDINYNIKIK